MLAVEGPVGPRHVPELNQLEEEEDLRRQQGHADDSALVFVTVPGSPIPRGSWPVGRGSCPVGRGSLMRRGPVGPLWLWIWRCFLVFFNPVVKVGDPGEDTGAGDRGLT